MRLGGVRILATLVTATLVFSSALAAQSTGAIEGRVVAEETGAPVSGATVTLSGGARGAITGADGEFRLDGLVPGKYRVEAAFVGRRTVAANVPVRAGQTARPELAMPLGPVLLPGVVVSASRVPLAAEQATATVNVVPSSVLRTSPGRTPADLLREAPGVELPRISGTVAGPEQILSIRGTDEGRALVLLDDVPLNDPWGEWIDWNRATLSTLERVEVTEGGGSSLYGNYAMGGVVRLVSRPIEPGALYLRGDAGSRELYDLSAAASDVRGRLAFAADGSVASGGGYVMAAVPGEVDEATENTRRNAGARIEYALGSNRSLSVRASVLDEERDAGTPLSETSRTIGGGSAGLEIGDVGGGRVTANLFANAQSQRSLQTITDSERTSEVPAIEQTIPAHDAGGTLQWSRNSAGPLDVFAVGADLRYMVGRLDEDVFDGSGAVERTRSSGGSQLVGGAFVQGTLVPAPRLRIEASARVDAWHNWDGSRAVSDSATVHFDARSDAAFAPRLGARYEVVSGLVVRGSVFRAFRAPTLSEQYRTFVSGNNTFLPNPDLGSEHLMGGDLGVDWRPAPAVEVRATVFDNEMSDLTSFTFLEPGYLQRQNVGEAHSRGVELSLALQPTGWIRMVGSYNYDDARTEAGARVARVPLQRAVVRATLGELRRGEVTGIYRHEGTMAALGGASLRAYDVFDLTARRRVADGTDLVLSVENVTDERYLANKQGPFEQIGLPRTVRLGISVAAR